MFCNTQSYMELKQNHDSKMAVLTDTLYMFCSQWVVILCVFDCVCWLCFTFEVQCLETWSCKATPNYHSATTMFTFLVFYTLVYKTGTFQSNAAVHSLPMLSQFALLALLQCMEWGMCITLRTTVLSLTATNVTGCRKSFLKVHEETSEPHHSLWLQPFEFLRAWLEQEL